MNKIRRGNREGSRLFGYLMVVPATLLLVVVSIIPLLDGVYLAFTNTNLNTGADAWVGIQNFVEIFQDSKFYQVFGFTILYAFAVVLFSYILGMLIALLLNQDIRFRGVFRAIILAPWVVPPVVATITWSWLLNDKVGLINTVLQNIGMIQEPIYFLSDLTLVKGTVIAFGVWKSYPFMMITLLAGMQSIDGVLYEAAKIDGANEFQVFTKICIPICKGVITTCAILVFMDYWNMVEQPLLFFNDTDKYPLSIFLSKINAQEVGLAFAVATFYMIPSLLIFLYGEDQLVEGIAYQGGVKG